MNIIGTERRKIGAILLPLIVLLAAACSGAASTVATDDGAPQAASQIPTSNEVSSPTTSAASPSMEAPASDEASAPTTGAASPSMADALDADSIVAAQGEVLNRIYEDLLPSVVQIRVAQQVGSSGGGFPFGFEQTPPDFLRQGEGSGFVWSDEGHIVTNHHVVDGADRVTVIFADGSMEEAEILGSDPDSDLAILKVDMPSERLKPVTLGDSDTAEVGELVAAIGNPFGQEFTLTSGIVSAVGRMIRSGNSPFSVPKVIQTDAAINPGNSGGPLLDRLGRVIGINTQIISDSGSSAGVGFAVPINTAKRVVPELIENGRFEYAWLGISGAELTRDTIEARSLPEDVDGVLVIEATQGGPADRANLEGIEGARRVDGLEVPAGGDIIVGIDGMTITEMEDLIVYLIENTQPGDRVTLDVIRADGERAEIEVTLGARPS